MAMVELEPVTGEVGNALTRLDTDMTQHDAERLHKLLENHARYTNSERAKDILANWQAYLPKFLKVMPTEYRRALNELANEAEQARPAAGE
jgi:glutamate synthase (NADPH/NADH) large chain